MFLPVRWLCSDPCPAKHGPGAQREKRRKANSKRRYAGLRVPNPQTGAPHRGQNKSRFWLDAAHIVPKNKMRRFQDEISGKNADRAALSGATGKSLTAAHTMHGKSRGNTDLLTCVRETFFLLRPRPTFSQVVPAMANVRPGGSLRFGVASRAQHRFVSAFLPASLPVLLKRALRTWRVLRYFNIQFYSKSSSVGILRTRRGAPSR